METSTGRERTMTEPQDDNCVTRTVALMTPGDVPLQDSQFWCHGCRVRQPIAAAIDLHKVGHIRGAQILRHLIEVYPCTSPKEEVAV